MFVFDCKNGKMPDMAQFKENLDLEVFLVDTQVSKETHSKDTIYSIFINFAIFEYLGLDSGSILEKFNNAFKLTEENNLKVIELKSKLNEVVSLANTYDSNLTETAQTSFLSDLEDKLSEYYKTKCKLERDIIKNDNTIDELITKLQTYKPIPLEVPDPIELDREITKPRQEQILDTKLSINPKDIDIDILKNPLDDSIDLPIKDDEKNIDDSKSLHVEDKDNEETDTSELKIEIESKKTEETNIDEQKHEDNMTLLISELENTVYLPYQIEDLEAILEDAPGEYKDIDDLIQSEYILPLDIFKNAVLSRFKEGYRLIRNKEKESIMKALSIGLELMNNYKLHPAIIAACKNEDELYIYLDCLEKNQLNKFKFFDIKFDMNPTTK